jgi:hypothetical protein
VIDWVAVQLGALEWHHLAAVLAILLAEQVAARLGMWWYALATMPGTIAHESAHYVVALALNARPDLPRILPQETEHGWRMGSVTFRAGLWRALPIALAPFALAPLSLWYAAHFLPGAPHVGWFALHAWVSGTMLSASLPSRADWRLALPALAFLGLTFVLLWLVR